MQTSDMNRSAIDLSGEMPSEANRSGSMPSETNRSGAMPSARSALLAVLLCIVLTAVSNAALSFLIEPYMGSSEEMWHYYAEQNKLDRVYTGTSQALSALDPEVIDEITGTPSYNMATNMQSLTDSYEVFRSAISDHAVSEAVIVIDHEILMTSRYENFRAAASFWHGKSASDDLAGRVSNAVNFVTDPAFFGKPISVTYFFPWIYNRSTAIGTNIREKLSCSSDSDGHRTSYGFEPSDDIVDQNQVFISYEEAREWTDGHPELEIMEISAENEAQLQKICALCADNNVKLSAIIVPYPNFMSIHNVYSYDEVSQQLADLFASYGFSFADFNTGFGNQYAPIEAPYEAASDDFKDVGHMNTQGAQKFSAHLAEYLMK